MTEKFTSELVKLDLAGNDRRRVTTELAELLVTAGRVTDLDGFLADVAEREKQLPTGIEGGIGIPHARSAHVTEPAIAFGRSSSGVDFGAEDGPANLIFLIAAPDGAGSEHMTVLATLARKLMHTEFRRSLREAADADTVVDLVGKEVLEQ